MSLSFTLLLLCCLLCIFLSLFLFLFFLSNILIVKQMVCMVTTVLWKTINGCIRIIRHLTALPDIGPSQYCNSAQLQSCCKGDSPHVTTNWLRQQTSCSSGEWEESWNFPSKCALLTFCWTHPNLTDRFTTFLCSAAKELGAALWSPKRTVQCHFLWAAPPTEPRFAFASRNWRKFWGGWLKLTN